MKLSSTAENQCFHQYQGSTFAHFLQLWFSIVIELGGAFSLGLNCVFFSLMCCPLLVPFERRNVSGLVNKATEPLLREAKVSRRLLLLRSLISMAEDPLFPLRSTRLRGRCHHPSFILARSRTISATISEHLRGCSAPPRGCSAPPRGYSVPSRGCSVPPRGCSVPPRGFSAPFRGCSILPRPVHLNVLSDDMRNLWAQVSESPYSEADGHWSSFPHQLHDPGQITDLQGLTFLICVMGFSWQLFIE